MSDNNNSTQPTSKPASTSGLRPPSKLAPPRTAVPKLSSASSSTASTASTTIGNGMTSTLASASNSTSSLNNAASLSSNANNNTNITAVDSQADDLNLLNEFKVNDRIWVNGSKPGLIAFIGETQFKEGIWAGIILDTAEGKNNGTLNGVTYFVTDENRGVFCRLNKLTKTSVQSSNSIVESSSTIDNQIKNKNSLNVGDRVLINSSIGGPVKIGTLRYLGETDFAKGEWAGVELDEKVGKNDGSVAGKRYFTCEPLYGVFAPIAKVEFYKENVNPSATPQQQSRLTTQTGTVNKASPLKTSRISKQFSGSQESLVSEKSSIYSTASSALKKRTSLLATQPKTALPKTISKNVPPASVSTPSASTLVKKTPIAQPVLQQSLKEKEGHIAQLLKERDFERSEFTRAAQKFEQTEAKLIDQTRLIQEKDQEIFNLNKQIQLLEESKNSFMKQQDEQRARIEDLEFQIEEHKLGVVKVEEDYMMNKQSNESPSSSKHNDSKEEDDILMQQLQLQKDINKNQLEEIKFLKEQIDSFNIDLKQLRLGEEVYAQEKRDMKKLLDELETKFNIAKKDADESYQLKDQVKDLELKLKYVNDESELTKQNLNAKINDLNNQIQIVESQRSELEFLYEEANAKFGDLNLKFEDKDKECLQLRSDLNSAKQSLNTALTTATNNSQDDLEFALEEQKVLVQDLESKLNNMEKMHQEEANKLNDLIKEKLSIENSKSAQISELESKITNLNEQIDSLKKIESEYNYFKEQKQIEIDEINLRLTKMNESTCKTLNEKDENLNTIKIEYEEFKKQKQIELNDLNLKLKSLNESKDKTSNEKDEHLNKMKIEYDEFKKQKEIEMTKLSEQNVELQNRSNQIEVLLNESKNSNAELQARINELIQNSGDYSLQLTSLNEQVIEKDHLIESLKLNQASLESQIVNLNEANEKNSIQYNENAKNLQNQLNEINKLKETEISKFNDEIKSLKEKCLQSETLLNETKNSNQELETRINELIQNSGDYSLQLTSLNENLKEKEKQIETLQEYGLNLQTQIQNLTDSLKQKSNDLTSIQNEYTSYKNEKEDEIKKISQEKRDLNEKCHKNETLLEESKNSISELQARINELIQNSGDYSLQLVNLNENIKEKDKLIETLQSSVFNLETQLVSLNDMNRKSNDKLLQAQTQNENLQSENKNLNNELAEYKSQINNINNDIKLKSELANNQESDLKNLNLKLENYETKIKVLEQLNETLKNEQANLVNELKSKNDELIKQIENEKNELAKLNNLNQTNETKLKEFDRQINDLVKEKEELARKKLELEQAKERIELDLKSTQSSNQAQTNHEIETLRKELAEIQTKLLNEEEKNSQTIQDYEMTINDLKQMLAQNDEQNEYKAQFDALESELNNHKDLLAEYEAENEQLRHEIEQLKTLKQMNMKNSDRAESTEIAANSFKLASSIKPTPRLFCDICDEFDLHDTEDCPQQSMPAYLQEKETHSSYNAVKSANRAYCDICEEFGHEEENCPKQNGKQNLSDEEF